jgi:hypothetical protein
MAGSGQWLCEKSLLLHLGCFGHFLCLRAFRPLRDLELDFLTLFESLEAVALNGAIVNKNVGCAGLFDETIALRVIKPLDLTGYSRHSKRILLRFGKTGALKAETFAGKLSAPSLRLMLVSRMRIFEMDALHGKASQSTKRLHAVNASKNLTHYFVRDKNTELSMTWS